MAIGEKKIYKPKATFLNYYFFSIFLPDQQAKTQICSIYHDTGQNKGKC